MSAAFYFSSICKNQDYKGRRSNNRYGPAQYSAKPDACNVSLAVPAYYRIILYFFGAIRAFFHFGTPIP
jgi:hypothetical protein